MEYIVSASVSLNYVIPIAKAQNSNMSWYHVEVVDLTTGSKRTVGASGLVAAKAPSTLVPAGETGLASFYNLRLDSVGPYMFDVYYDENYPSTTKVGSTSAYKVGQVSTLTVV